MKSKTVIYEIDFGGWQKCSKGKEDDGWLHFELPNGIRGTLGPGKWRKREAK